MPKGVEGPENGGPSQTKCSVRVQATGDRGQIDGGAFNVFHCVLDVVQLQDVIRVHTGMESRVVVRQVETGNSEAMRAILRELRQQRISRFFVHLSYSDTALFLKAVIQYFRGPETPKRAS